MVGQSRKKVFVRESREDTDGSTGRSGKGRREKKKKERKRERGEREREREGRKP